MSTSTAPGSPAPTPAASRVARLADRYREDHQHPVNHVLHVYVGWPICALGVLLLPFNYVWTIAAFVAGYAVMWTGHFVFERNIPTVLKHPTTPFVIAWTVITRLVGGLIGLVRPDLRGRA